MCRPLLLILLLLIGCASLARDERQLSTAIDEFVVTCEAVAACIHYGMLIDEDMSEIERLTSVALDVLERWNLAIVLGQCPDEFIAEFDAALAGLRGLRLREPEIVIILEEEE